VRTRTEGTARPRAPLQSRILCQACAASAFFCRPGSGARSVGRRTVPSSNPAPRAEEHTHASVWIATSFRPRPRMHKHANVWWSLQLHELCALHTDSLFPAALAAVLSSCGDRRTVAAPRHGAAAPHRAGMGIKRRPVESPGAHACAAAPRALHTRLLSSHPYFR